VPGRWFGLLGPSGLCRPILSQCGFSELMFLNDAFEIFAFASDPVMDAYTVEWHDLQNLAWNGIAAIDHALQETYRLADNKAVPIHK
jgi:hypothetical protein